VKRARSGGGWQAIRYSLKLASKVGWRNMWNAMRSRNTCKTCAVGMGGQLGGMVNEGGHFPEVCKKSFQAMASDMQPPIPEEFLRCTTVAQLQAMSPRALENSGRLVTPLLLRAGEQHYQPISWDEALQAVSNGLTSAGPDRSFFYASGRSSNEAGFLLQLFARLLGTNYVNNCSYYCHQASGVGLGMALGTGAGTVKLQDVDGADFYMLIGANPASNHPRLMRSLMQLRRRGGTIVVVNPLMETGLVNFKVPSDVRSMLFGSQIASVYLQPHIGGDLALMTGLAKHVLQSSGHNDSFICNHTEGFDQFRQQVEESSWDDIVARSGISEKDIRNVGELYRNATNAIFAWCMGITHHLHGTRSVHSIANLALLRGMVGKANAGVMPIRGHSNVQGLGSVGVTPVLKQAILQRFETQLGIEVPKSPGYDTMACMEAAGRGEMHVALCMGGNLYGSSPDSEQAIKSLRQLKTVVYLSTTLNTGHAFGTGEQTLILPVLPRDEEPQPTTQESMFSFVRFSDGGKQRYDGPRSEVRVLGELARSALPSDVPVDWDQLQSHAAIRELMADLIPEYEELKTIDQTKTEFHVAGRAVRDFRFPTASGKARFHAVAIDENQHSHQIGGDQVRLMTLRSEGQFNSVVYDEYDVYRGMERRDVILMNASDMERLRLTHDQRVRVTSSTGELRFIHVRTFDIRSGNAAMYYPEANVLVSANVDPLSKTPAFKCVAVTVTAEEQNPA
jgi:molybdopterin-dependent oxidoreductase alpha subunit